jgi:hypothetical protein
MSRVGWYKDGANQVDREAVRVECGARAAAIHSPTTVDRRSTQGAEFLVCLQENGWEQS